MDNKVTADLDVLNNVQDQIANYNDVVDGAKLATESEKNMSFKVAIRRYPKAVLWSILLSTAM